MPGNGIALSRSRYGLSPGAHWVPGDASAPADCVHEKDLQMQAFSPSLKRLKEFEPSTFCMASRA